MNSKFWEKVFEALISALLPALIKAFEEWLGSLTDEQVAAAVGKAMTTPA